MSKVGQVERKTQDRVIKLFKDHLDYEYLGNWESESDNHNINEDLLGKWLAKQGYSSTQINKSYRELDRAAALGAGKNLYDANDVTPKK